MYRAVLQLLAEHPTLSNEEIAQISTMPADHVRLLRAGTVPAGAVADAYRAHPYAQLGDVARALGVSGVAVASVINALLEANLCFAWREPRGLRVSVHYDAPSLGS